MKQETCRSEKLDYFPLTSHISNNFFILHKLLIFCSTVFGLFILKQYIKHSLANADLARILHTKTIIIIKHEHYSRPGCTSAVSKLLIERMLQSQGFGSRKWCRELIVNGDVCINGIPVTDIRSSIDTDNLEYSVYGEFHRFREHIYVALNKPAGYECSRKPSHHPGVLSLFPEQFSRRDVQPVGRLDHDTTGLLLMSDDGTFIHTQSSPKHHVSKVYVATTHDSVTPQLVGKLLAGVKLHDEPHPLAAISCQMIDTHRLEIILEQGKYHQVKRMLAAAGNHCMALQRSRIGLLNLETLELAEGEWCYLEENYKALLV